MEEKGLQTSSEAGVAPPPEAIVEVVDVEEYTQRGQAVPMAKHYKIRVNGDLFVVDEPVITGRQILTVARLLPPEQYTLRLKRAGQKPEKIGLDEPVDLRGPGIEKFKALPRDQTEG